MPNLVQEILCCFQTTGTLACLLHPLIVSIKETKMFIPAAETLPSMKTYQIADSMVPTESIDVISLLGDSFTDARKDIILIK